MDFVPVASFPFQEWADDVAEQFVRAGLSPRVEIRGPRAVQISVAQSEFPAAELIMGVLGYFTCAVN